MPVVTVSAGGGDYDVVIERGALAACAPRIAPFCRNRGLFVAFDPAVAPLLATLTAALAEAAITVAPIAVPGGEASKGWRGLEALCEALLALGIERGEPVAALGGGVVGDLAGLAAALLKRGCPVIQLPTTLLAQVDSAVGGKTAINAAAGKNLIGVFHPPALVLADPDALATLPLRERRAGYAEVVKYGLIDDPALFAWCEAHAAAVLANEPAAIEQAVAASVRAKARIVAADERETADLRALLNLGHTFGHALEAETGFSDRLLHGEAVAAGMAIAFRFSAALGLCPPADATRVTVHLRAQGLPTSARGAGVTASGARLAGHMAQDKKRAGAVVPLILARGIGQAFVSRDVQLADAAAFLDSDG